jgi:hypothetical protein
MGFGSLGRILKRAENNRPNAVLAENLYKYKLTYMPKNYSKMKYNIFSKNGHQILKFFFKYFSASLDFSALSTIRPF